MPSYAKTGAAYTLKIVVEANGNILKALCLCPAGADGRCNHFAETLFAIEDKQGRTADREKLRMFLLPLNQVSKVFH